MTSLAEMEPNQLISEYEEVIATLEESMDNPNVEAYAAGEEIAQAIPHIEAAIVDLEGA